MLKGQAWQQASDYAVAEMLTRTTERKEADDRFDAQLDAAAQDCAATPESPTTPTD